MASSPKHLLVIFLLVLFSVKHINARQSNFFSKFTHYNSNDQKPKFPISQVSTLAPTPAPEDSEMGSLTSPTPTPTPEDSEVGSLTSPTPTPTPAPSDIEASEYAYGLYGHDFKDQFSSSKKIPTTIHRENQLVNEQLAAESFETPTNNYNVNSYTNYPNNNNNGYEMKQEGMSDTRFLDNGRYYHDVKNYNNDQYESENGSSRNDQTYYFRNNEKYEFDTMDEYDRYQKSQKLPYWP